MYNPIIRIYAINNAMDNVTKYILLINTWMVQRQAK